MIKFFRNIRRALLSGNKVRKYLLYAIGEIILVVIGILIAVTINSWNEGRKEVRKERELYSKLISDLDKELSLIEKAIEDLKEHEDLHYHLFYVKSGQEQLEQEMPYGILRWSVPFIPTFKDSYQSKVDKITKSSLRDAVNEYFQLEQRAINRNMAYEKMKADLVRPYITANGLIKVEDIYVVDRYQEVDVRTNIDLDVLSIKINTPEFARLLIELKVKTVATIKHLEYLYEANRGLKASFEALLSSE